MLFGLRFVTSTGEFGLASDGSFTGIARSLMNVLALFCLGRPLYDIIFMLPNYNLGYFFIVECQRVLYKLMPSLLGVPDHSPGSEF